MLHKNEYIDTLRANIAQFVAAAKLGLEPTVAACPEWSVGQLVFHLGEVYDFWSTVVERRASDQQAINEIHQARKADLDRLSTPDFFLSPTVLEYFDAKAAAIVKALSNADPAQPNWTWWPGDQTAGFVQRRMCHETTIHRWDVQAAHGRQESIAPADIAADGIDEELNNELTGWSDEGKSFPTASFHLHCTDVEGEWLVFANGRSVELKREHARADVAVTGEASNLILWLWHRLPIESVTVHGDPDQAGELRDMLEQD